jgi:hypothetical protein
MPTRCHRVIRYVRDHRHQLSRERVWIGPQAGCHRNMSHGERGVGVCDPCPEQHSACCCKGTNRINTRATVYLHTRCGIATAWWSFQVKVLIIIEKQLRLANLCCIHFCLHFCLVFWTGPRIRTFVSSAIQLWTVSWTTAWRLGFVL